MASFAGEGSPFNKVAGLGFGGVPDAAALDEIEQAFATCGSPVQIELAHLADPAIGELLTGRGYRLESFENVLGRALTDERERDLRDRLDEELSAFNAAVTGGGLTPALMPRGSGVTGKTGVLRRSQPCGTETAPERAVADHDHRR